MKTLRLIAMALIGVALIAGLFQLQKEPELLRHAAAPAPKPESLEPAAPADTEAHTAEPARPTAPLDPARQFRESTDYWLLADELRPLATRGDAAAQYWLSRVYFYCDQEFGRAFNLGSDGKYLTPEDVLQQSPDENATALRLVFRRCEKLVKEGHLQFNDYDHLLQSASKAGYPRAQVEAALFRVGRGPDGTADALTLTRQSLQSRDPEVVMSAARVAMRLNAPDMHVAEDEAARARERASLALYAWQAAACLRGADCSPEADWVRRWCGRDNACQPFETGMDLLRRHEPHRFDVIMMRAREINDQIDAGRWDEIELR